MNDKPKPIIQAVTPDRSVVRAQFRPADAIDNQLFDALFAPENLNKWFTDFEKPSDGKKFALRMDELGLINREDLEASLQRIFHHIGMEPPKIMFSGNTTAVLQLPIKDFTAIQDNIRALSDPSQTP